ncbi:ankyrin repeat-containing domain protein [Tricladium varicosporioides]|nr:ankyrin repeat-containing domain protein [Hymenoscyphus varicosporioides]
MSVVALDSTSHTGNTNGPVIKSLETALSEFGSVLTDDERKQLQQIKGVPNASAALVFTAKLDASNLTRRGKSIGARAYSMLQSIQQFSTIVDTFVSAHPDIAALVWGSVKLTVLIAANITSYFESLADLFMSLNKLFPQFDEYQLLFPNSSALQESICTFHASIVQLCKQAILLTRQPWVRKVTLDLRGRLRPHIENVQICAKDIKTAIALAKAISDRKEEQFQEQERKLASIHRKQFSIFASQSQREHESFRKWQVQRDQELLREKKIKLLDSLSTYKYETGFHQARKKRHVNTATWLFSTPEFVKWKDSQTLSVFVLTGKLGSGKTVLTSSVIEYLHCERTGSNELTTFAFPRFDDSISLSAATILRSIIRQSIKPDDVTGEVERQLSRFKTSDADLGTIQTLLRYCISKHPTLYIVIDALDEFEGEERSILLRSLSSIISVPDSKAKIFLVGRSSILTDTRRWFPASQEKSADCHEVQADIEAYTRETITIKQGEQLLLQDPALAKEIIKALSDGANGMFLWVDYQIAEICECACDDEIREVLSTLPKSLGETFNRAMKRIAKRASAKTARRIFRWAAAAKRALTLDELREALSYEPGKPYSTAGKRPSGLERITTWCENLVQLDEELQIVQFTHHSVLQHFLEQPLDSSLQDFHINLEEADHFVGEICVTYLNSNDFKTDLIRNPAVFPSRLPEHIIKKTSEVKSVPSRIIQKLSARSYRKSTSSTERVIVIKDILEDPTVALQLGHPFLEYALDYWLLHTRNFEEGKSKTWNLWIQMVHGSHNLARTPWSPAEFYGRNPVIYKWIEKYNHLAVFLHVLSIAKLSPTEGQDLVRHHAILGHLNYINILINLVSKEALSHGLLYASSHNHLEVVQRLLDAKADVNATAEGEGHTALQAAAGGGHLEIVQRLLDAKADINATSTIYRTGTALEVAAESGHLEVVQILLDAKANNNSSVGEIEGYMALQAAVKCGHLEVVQRLLDAKADINASAAKTGGRTALQAAAEGGHLEVVQRLLDAKADVNATAARHRGRTALQAAAGGGHLEVVQRLLDAKADVNASAARYSGRTALQAASEGGHLEVVQRLLDAKADANASAAEVEGRTALHAAAGGGHLEVVQRLLDAKADVNASAAESWGRTALQAAAEGGYLEVVQTLLGAKADVNAPVTWFEGLTALQAAAGGGHLEVVQRLLDAKADVNASAARHRGRTALQAAAGGGHLEVVQRLLDAKADINATAAESWGQTALQAAAGGGHLEVVQRLLDAKADINATAAESWGQTALQAAAGGGHLEVVQRLLDAKADINATAAESWGQTALQAAAGGGHLEVVQRLLDAKADINATAAESRGRTALQAAAEGGYLEVVQTLLDANADVNAPVAWFEGLTALQAAAGGGHLEVVQRLLDAKADVNASAARHRGRTALQAAAGGSHLEVVQRLLDAKADVNASAAKSGGRTALQVAAEGGHLEVVQRLLDGKADVNASATEVEGRTALQAAAEGGHLEVIQRLLDAKADVNASATEVEGRTALQAAAGGGHLEVVQRLLDAKADVNASAVKTGGRTALQAAAEGGHLEVVQRLLDAKANVNASATEFEGRTALQAAAGGGHLKVVQRLLDAKADVNASAARYSGRTALQAASEGGHLEVVQRLLDAKANVNASATEFEGRTALQAAAGGGHLKVVQRLLDAKADVNASAARYSGRTALQAAAEGGHLEVVQTLLDAKADVYASAAKLEGRTALQAATESGHLEVLELLNTFIIYN